MEPLEPPIDPPLDILANSIFRVNRIPLYSSIPRDIHY